MFNKKQEQESELIQTGLREMVENRVLISTIVSKKEMSTECPNWVQFIATEIEAARRLKNK